MAGRSAQRIRGIHGGGEALTTIEPLTPEHFATVAGWLSSPDLNQWLTSEWRGRVIEPTVIGIAFRNKKNRFFLVRAEGQPCGLVALADWDPVDQIAMVWYALGETSLGSRGVITDAVGQLTRIALDELDIHALYAWIIEDNARSRRVLEKNGFVEMGHLRSGAVRDGRRMDRVYFCLSKDQASVAS